MYVSLRSQFSYDLEPLRVSSLFKYGDDNGLILAPTCNPSNDGVKKCFDSFRQKQCSHKTDTVPLNLLGQYVLFPSRWWHKGFYNIRSDRVFYTAQLFCTAAQDPDSWSNHTRKQNRNMTMGGIAVSQMQNISTDIQNNWDTTYSESKFPPSKAFDGGKIDRSTNRHLQRNTWNNIPDMCDLVNYFESHYRRLRVDSVWLIKKTRENDGFQGWHRDFYLKTDIITTIVVNVGVGEVNDN